MWKRTEAALYWTLYMLGILATAEGEMTRPQAPDSFSNMYKQPLTMVVHGCQRSRLCFSFGTIIL